MVAPGEQEGNLGKVTGTATTAAPRAGHLRQAGTRMAGTESNGTAVGRLRTISGMLESGGGYGYATD